MLGQYNHVGTIQSMWGPYRHATVLSVFKPTITKLQGEFLHSALKCSLNIYLTMQITYLFCDQHM